MARRREEDEVMTEQSLSNSLTHLAAHIVAEHEQVSSAMQHGLAHAISAGNLLIEAKRRTEHVVLATRGAPNVDGSSTTNLLREPRTRRAFAQARRFVRVG